MEKLKFDADYLKHLARGVSREPEIIIVPETHYVGLKTLLHGVGTEKNNMADKLGNLWAQFMPIRGQVKSAKGETGFGLIKQSVDPSGQLEYFSVLPVFEIPSQAPDSMVVVTVPEQKFARFTHRGRFAEFNHTINYIYSSWLLNSDYVHTYQYDVEEYGAGYHPTSDESVIYYSIPIE